MRTLGFRVWSKKHNRYLNISGLHYDDGKIDGVYAIYGAIAGIPNVIFLEPEDVILEQDTGLKDKNGEKIREGDIIKVVNVHDGDDECWEQPSGPAIPQEVKWDEERLRWSFGGCGRILYAPEDFEVIGNIHENPELLGAE